MANEKLREIFRGKWKWTQVPLRSCLEFHNSKRKETNLCRTRNKKTTEGRTCESNLKAVELAIWRSFRAVMSSMYVDKRKENNEFMSELLRY